MWNGMARNGNDDEESSEKSLNRVTLKLLSSHEIDLEYANCLTVVCSTGEVVIHGVVAGEEDRNRKYAFHAYRRTDDGLRSRSIVPTCQDDAVEILPIRKGDNELLAVSCPGCRNIKLLDAQTGSSITAFSDNQYKPDLMCHGDAGDAGSLYVFSLRDPYPVLELTCDLDSLFTAPLGTIDSELRRQSVNSVPNGSTLDFGTGQSSTDTSDSDSNGPSEILDSGLRRGFTGMLDSVFTGPLRTLDSGLRQWCTGMCYLPTPNRAIVLSIASEGIIRAISVDRNEISWEVTGEVDGLRCNPWGLMYSARHEGLLVCDGDNRRILVLDPSDGTHRQTLPLPGTTGSTYDIASHDDQIVLLHQTKISYLSIS